MGKDLLAAAEDYTARRLRVIALTGKAPNVHIHKRGLYDSFGYADDPTIGGKLVSMEEAFEHPDTTGIGILTGPTYYVVDIDGEEGAQAWKALVGDGMFIPDRWVARTGRGLHLWFAHFEQWGTVKLADKLDFKGVGGYVAAPPSAHPEGHTYEWLIEPGDDPPWAMPEALERVLYRRRAEQDAIRVTKSALKQMAPSSLHDGKFYAVATFEGIIDKVRKEDEGNRNAVLYWAARTMIEEGADNEDLEELLNAARDSGLARYEARRTIRSAVEASGG